MSSTAATLPDATDAIAEMLAAAPATDREGAALYAGLVRTMSVGDIRATVEASAAKVAKRIPGLAVEVIVEHYVPANGRPMLWCDSHRRFDCTDSDAEFTNLPCRKAPADASTVEVWATGLPMWDGTWAVAGVLTRDADTGALMAHTVGSMRDDDLFAHRHADLMGQCRHCNVHRNRTVTVLLHDSATGEIRPVGRRCLTEYTGGAIRVELLATLTGLAERFATEISVMLDATPATAPTDVLVALATRYIAAHGFHPADVGYPNIPTASLVRDAACPAEGSTQTITPQMLTAADMDAARADIALVLAADTDSGYMANLKEAAGLDWNRVLGRRNPVGLLASLPRAADRIRTQAARDALKAERDAERASQVQAFIGAVGDKREFTGKLVVNQIVDSAFGTKNLALIVTPEGTVKVLATFRAIEDVEVGTDVTVFGTISKHDDYDPAKPATCIIRVKLISS